MTPKAGLTAPPRTLPRQRGGQFVLLVAIVLAVVQIAAPARADLTLCNRMSYVLDAAIALAAQGTVASRGWFRLDPGQCRTVLQGELSAEQLYLHARTLPIYGTAPVPQAGHADFCVAEKDFVIAPAQRCRSGETAVRFTEVKPSTGDRGLMVTLDEESKDNYDNDQARLAGIQRLLAIAGYDASPIDGVAGPKTDAALGQFFKDHNLASDAAAAPDFFATLLAAAQRPAHSGFSWCNETRYAVMAALGIDDKEGIVTRGWYRVAPGTCLRPDMNGRPRRIYSFAEAIDAKGEPVKKTGAPLAWGGNTLLCTRPAKFELNEHKDCRARGLDAAGFAQVDLSTQAGSIVRFKE